MFSAIYISEDRVIMFWTGLCFFFVLHFCCYCIETWTFLFIGGEVCNLFLWTCLTDFKFQL